MPPNRLNQFESSNQVGVGLVRGVAPPDGEVAGISPPMRGLNVCAGRSVRNASRMTGERESTAAGIDPAKSVGGDGDWKNAIEWGRARATHATHVSPVRWRPSQSRNGPSQPPAGKRLRMELPQMKPELERELGRLLLHCRRCNRRVRWVPDLSRGTGRTPLTSARPEGHLYCEPPPMPCIAS